MRPADLGASLRRRRQASHGFTLLEVLAAVAILAIWYMVMASIATQGLRAEGESHRRLRASLLADEILADLESSMPLGVAPPVQSEEEERGEFGVRIDVEPYSLEFEALPDAANAPGKPEAALQKLIQASGESLLREIRVEVTWMEGFTLRRVSRSSFGLDLTPVLADLAKLAPDEVDDSAAESNGEAPTSETGAPTKSSGS